MAPRPEVRTAIHVHRSGVGQDGEQIAADRLTRRGWHILARNQRVKGVRGELDIIAIDGDTLVIVEVKTRSTMSRHGPEAPLAAITRRKQAKLRALGRAWIDTNLDGLPRFRRVRYDAIGIRLTPAGEMREWKHIEGAI